ncbi:unnamed protein product, partial [Tenebrio molitor]
KKRKTYKQKFKEQWKEEYDFIDIRQNDCATICKVCNIVLRGGSFHIKRHASSKLHIEKYNALKTTPKIKSILTPKVTLNEQIKKAEIRIVTFLCENDLPLSLADNLTELIKEEVFKNPEVVKSMRLKRTKATDITNNLLGPIAKKDVGDRLKKEKFSIIVDETTDIATKKSLVINCRFYNQDQRKIKDHFAELVEVENCSAESLFSAVKAFLDKNQVPYNNVVGFGSDNANVMMGEFNSVQQKLTEICPGIVVRGCGCHSLHLVASHAAKKLPNVIEQFVRDVYNHFSNSPKRMGELYQCQVFAEEKPTKMLKPSQTRWLSLKEVCTRVLEHWNSLTLHFQATVSENNLPSAKAILNALNNPVYKLYLQFLKFNLE